jgi:hypothetical protein
MSIHHTLCVQCDESYPESTTGECEPGLPSELYEDEGRYFILSHYGSCYDTAKHVFPKDAKGLSVGRICDECIQKLLREKKIKEVQGFNYFG